MYRILLQKLWKKLSQKKFFFSKYVHTLLENRPLANMPINCLQ